jgi:hypothetical protein
MDFARVLKRFHESVLQDVVGICHIANSCNQECLELVPLGKQGVGGWLIRRSVRHESLSPVW